MSPREIGLVAFAVSIASLGGFSTGAEYAVPQAGKANNLLCSLPLYFIENQGQVDSDDVAFYVKGADKTLYFTEDGITFSLKGEDERWTVKLEFVGANVVKPVGVDKQQAVFSYFKGKPEDWKTGLPTYGKIVYEDLWPGIDLVYSGNVNQLKYEFIVKPGADPGKIRLAYSGVTGASVGDAGELKIATPAGCFEDGVPYAYQEAEGVRREVSVRYQLEAAGKDEMRCGFEVGEFDPTRLLFLDPVWLVYCGYIGGSQADGNGGIVVAEDGAAYVCGFAESDESTFPVTAGLDSTFNGVRDAFVAKVNPDGSALIHCVYIGGAGSDTAADLALDGTGAIYMTGCTSSDETTFPVIEGPDSTYNGGPCDAFVAKVNPTFDALVYCGYIGGASGEGTEGGCGIAVGEDAAYVVGTTHSDESSFPVTNGPDLTHNGSYDAFVAKVQSDGKQLEYCGYVGGWAQDWGYHIAVDDLGAAYITGLTYSTGLMDFPVKVGPDLTYNGGPTDGFVAKVAPGGAALECCGYIGGADIDPLSGDHCSGIALDEGGAVYVTGRTGSDESTFPVVGGPDLTYNGGVWDGYIAKVSPDFSRLEYCGYIGGDAYDSVIRIRLDDGGFIYVAGETDSSELGFFPATVGPDVTFNGARDGFVAKVRPDFSGIEYCGFIGGTGWDSTPELAVNTAGEVYVMGFTSSDQSSFPVRVGPDLTYNGGDYDAFVAKVSSYVAADIKANGEDGPVIVDPTELVIVNIALNPGSLQGEPADWWVFVEKDSQSTWWAKFRKGQAPKWTKAAVPIRFSGATLRNVSSYTVLGPRTLPMGNYVFTFAVDDKDGTYEGTFIDTVDVAVN